MSRLRKPRFQRSPEIPAMQLTERDRAIIRQVLRHRFLRSWQIAALVGGSKQAVLRRLQRLYHHGYLERPRAQIEYYRPGGSRPLVYGIAQRAMEARPVKANRADRSLDWNAKNAAVKRLFLEHALMISDVMVALELACRQHAGIRLLYADEISLPEAIHANREPFRWSVKLSNGIRLGVIPDRVFGLEFADRTADRDCAYFFLEADRGTMPVERESMCQSSFLRKLRAYEATWTQNLHGTRFGFHRFRVLVVTSSTERVKHLVTSCQQLERGQGLFLFTDLESFLTNYDPLTQSLQSGRSNQTDCLIDG